MPISIRGRRSRKEGWAADIGKEVAPSPRQRLANNTPLWIVCAVVVILCSVSLIAVSGRGSTKDPDLLKSLVPGDTSIGTYTDEAHQQFVRKIIDMERKRGFDVDVEFLSDDKLKIVVPSGSGFDEIAYLSRFAALGIKRHFGIRATIDAYSRDSKRPDKLILAAITEWDDGEMNFITKSQRAAEQN